jgi:hypothetical protein
MGALNRRQLVDEPIRSSALKELMKELMSVTYYSERFIGDTGVTFPSYEANSDGNKVSPIKRSHY